MKFSIIGEGILKKLLLLGGNSGLQISVTIEGNISSYKEIGGEKMVTNLN